VAVRLRSSLVCNLGGLGGGVELRHTLGTVHLAATAPIRAPRSYPFQIPRAGRGSWSGVECASIETRAIAQGTAGTFRMNFSLSMMKTTLIYLLFLFVWTAHAQSPSFNPHASETNREIQSYFVGLATNGNAVAQTYLCQWYGDSARTERMFQFPLNPPLALRWCREAAAQGRPETFSVLSFMYETGDVMPQSNIYAYMWAFLADRGGYPMERTIRRLTSVLSPIQVARAEELAARCQRSNFQQCELP